MAAQRIGLFGGSFDPVHLGHTMVARAALAEVELDRLFIIPAAQSPFKPEQIARAGSGSVGVVAVGVCG